MPGPDPVDLTPDNYMKCLGALAPMYQPGERWMYQTGSDVLGVVDRAHHRAELSGFPV
jgi:hypothetical protein